MNTSEIAKEIFLSAVDAVKPDKLIRRFVSLNQNILVIDKQKFDLSKIKNIYVIGFGKASALMAKTVEDILGDKITNGHIVVKYNHGCQLKNIKITEAAHPVPDENGLIGTNNILNLVSNANKNDLIICLISGGGSALLADVPEGSDLNELKKLNDILLKSGAAIHEINAIRKHLSKVKGGNLARAIFPATCISLILSDVIGDPLDVIASGPTVADQSTFKEVDVILKKYKIENQIPEKIKNILQLGLKGEIPDNPKKDDAIFKSTFNLLLGTNNLAVEVAREKAVKIGYDTLVLGSSIDGLVDDVAEMLAKKAIDSLKLNKKICILAGGEPTVKVSGSGLGGRNQHLALIMAKLLKDFDNITMLSGGTDGSDGPTDAAGAISDTSTYKDALLKGIDPEKYINNCDSYNFFKANGGLIITGPTQTNVMDVIVVLVN